MVPHPFKRPQFPKAAQIKPIELRVLSGLCRMSGLLQKGGGGRRTLVVTVQCVSAPSKHPITEKNEMQSLTKEFKTLKKVP